MNRKDIVKREIAIIEAKLNNVVSSSNSDSDISLTNKLIRLREETLVLEMFDAYTNQ